jgi:hypothetical protein
MRCFFHQAFDGAKPQLPRRRPVKRLIVMGALCVAVAISSVPCRAQKKDEAAIQTQSETQPSPAEQDKLLDLMGQYAEQYVSNLPNFICDQITSQYRGNKKGKHWRKGDTLTAKLTYTQGHEDRTLYLVNNNPIRPGSRRWSTPLVTEGEFGTLLERVLGPDDDAVFTWARWQTLRNKRVAVFDYIVDQSHSSLSLSLSGYVKATVPYTGSVYADPETGAIWRITDTATEIPPELQTESIGTTIDYAETPIGDAKYLLPLTAVVTMQTNRNQIRNEIQFQQYRKFETDSNITFGPPATTGPEPSKQAPSAPKE